MSFAFAQFVIRASNFRMNCFPLFTALRSKYFDAMNECDQQYVIERETKCDIEREISHTVME